MVLLARAQALSGRPGDALVMLGRLADLGVPTDAITNDDYRFVRLLPGWPALEARLTGKPAPPACQHPAPPAPSAPSTVSTLQHLSAPSAPLDSLEFEGPGLEPARSGPRRRVAPLRPRRSQGPPAARDRRGLASRRQLRERGVGRVLPGPHRVHAGCAPRDLWVVSASVEPGAAASALHKLQLVSGRALLEVKTEPSATPVRFVDAPRSSPDALVYALDGMGSRDLPAAAGRARAESVMRLEAVAAHGAHRRRRSRALRRGGEGTPVRRGSGARGPPSP